MQTMSKRQGAVRRLAEVRDFGAFEPRYVQVTGMWDPFDPPRVLRWLGVRPQER